MHLQPVGAPHFEVFRSISWTPMDTRAHAKRTYTQVHVAYSCMARNRICTLVGAISRTVIHKTITTCVAISTTVFKIGLHCEDKAVENGRQSKFGAVWRNMSHVETFRPIRRNDSFRNSHQIDRSPVFYVFVYYYRKRSRSHRKYRKYSFWQRLR